MPEKNSTFHSPAGGGFRAQCGAACSEFTLDMLKRQSRLRGDRFAGTAPAWAAAGGARLWATTPPLEQTTVETPMTAVAGAKSDDLKPGVAPTRSPGSIMLKTTFRRA